MLPNKRIRNCGMNETPGWPFGYRDSWRCVFHGNCDSGRLPGRDLFNDKLYAAGMENH